MGTFLQERGQSRVEKGPAPQSEDWTWQLGGVRDQGSATHLGCKAWDPRTVLVLPEPVSPARLLLLLLLSHFSHVQLCATPETAAHQAPRSLGFSRQEHWSRLPFPSPMYESEK